jgi:ribonuclease P protein component
MADEAVTRSTEVLPRNHRIQKRRDFLRAYEDGSRIFGRFVVVFSIANELGHPRLGVTVTRKLGNATARNRAKRWVREIFRTNRASTVGDLSVDFVVNVKPVTREAAFLDFSSDVVRTLKRAARDRTRS